MELSPKSGLTVTLCLVVSVESKGDEGEDSVVVKPLTQEPVVRAFFVSLVCFYFLNYRSTVSYIYSICTSLWFYTLKMFMPKMFPQM